MKMPRMDLQKNMLLFLSVLILTIQTQTSPSSSVQRVLSYEINNITIQIECFYPEIPPGTPEHIKVTVGTMESPPVRGKALLLVIQPNEAVNKIKFKNLLEKTGCKREQIEKILDRIGYDCVNVTGYLLITVPGGNKYVNTFIYPDDFDPIIGALSTEHPGRYKVILIYWGLDISHLSITIKYGFTCGYFHVIPEAIFGTASAVIILFSSLILKKRLRH